MRKKAAAAAVVMAASYALLPQVGYVWNDERIVPHLLYVFCHVNIWHLLGNILVLLSLRGRLRMIPAYMIAVAASFLPTLTAAPTMGCSGWLFAIMGMGWGEAGRLRDMTTKILPLLILIGLLPNVAMMIHIYCLYGGYIYGLWLRKRM